MSDENLFGEDHLFFHVEQTSEAFVQREVDKILQLLDCPVGCAILEVGCGEGRLLRELARRGYQVTGVDRSAKMIDAAISKTGQHPYPVYLLADVREMCDDYKFQAAFSWFTSFGFEDDNANLDILCSVRRSLLPGGRFLIDVVNRDFVIRNFRDLIVVERDNSFMIDRMSYDSHTARIRTERTYVRDGTRRVTFWVRLYSLPELANLLAQAGFGIVQPAIEDTKSGDIPLRFRLVATVS